MLFRFSVLLFLVIFPESLLGKQTPQRSAPTATSQSSDEEEYREAVRDAFKEAQRVTPWLIAPMIIVGIGALLTIYLTRRQPKIVTKDHPATLIKVENKGRRRRIS